MMNNIDKPILITGVDRSGGTIIASILRACGAFTGHTSNRYEHLGIKALVNSYLEEQIKINPKDQYPLPFINNDFESIPIVSNWKNSILDIIIKDSNNHDLIWLYKSARSCQIFPLWSWAFPEAKWIVIRRKSEDIIQSCMKTTYMHSYSNPEVLAKIGVSSEEAGWEWWINEHEKYFEGMQKERLDYKEVWPEKLSENNFQEIEEVVEWAGLSWNEEKVKDIAKVLNKGR